jgi:hypothetical protein
MQKQAAEITITGAMMWVIKNDSEIPKPKALAVAVLHFLSQALTLPTHNTSHFNPHR